MNSREIYYVDSLGFEDLMTRTEYYPDYSIPTSTVEPSNTDMIIILNGKLVTVSSPNIILSIELFSYTGRLLQKFEPYITYIEIEVRSGISFIRAKNESGIILKKIIAF